MIRTLALLAALFAAAPAFGQAPAPGQEELVARRTKKLEAPFLAKAEWITDYDRAREEARTSARLIFAYFTRSYDP